MLSKLPAILMAWTLLTATGFAAESPRKPVVTPAQVENAPLTIAVSTVGRFAKGSSWHLSVNSAGQAELTIETYPNRTVRRFEVSKEQIAAFRKALLDERFFELAPDYGEQVPDGSTRTVTIVVGSHANTVKVHFLGNWVRGDKSKLQEPSRAVRLLVMVRGWFDDAEAVDLGKYDKLVLDAVEK